MFQTVSPLPFARSAHEKRRGQWRPFETLVVSASKQPVRNGASLVTIQGCSEASPDQVFNDLRPRHRPTRRSDS